MKLSKNKKFSGGPERSRRSPRASKGARYESAIRFAVASEDAFPPSGRRKALFETSLDPLLKDVDLSGLEPLTSCLQSRRSTS